MARFFGAVGYGDSVEDPEGSGVWVDQVTERSYYGDITRDTRQLVKGDKVNEDISVSNSISILADAYAIESFHKIKYIKWAGGIWTVTDVEVRIPRLFLTLGTVYNGPLPEPDPEE